jgi:hypothetical protein
MTIVFRGYSHDPDNLDYWANALTIETAEDVLPDKITGLPVVRVDTNYKPDRTGKHPLNLTIADAIKAAAYLVTHAQNSMEAFADEALDQLFDDAALLGLQKQLTDVDSATWELRTWLLNQAESRPKADGGTELPAAVTLLPIHPADGEPSGDQLDAAFLPQAIEAVKRLDRKQMPFNGEPIPWWPLEVDQVRASYIAAQLFHPLAVIAAHAQALTDRFADQPATRGLLTDVVGGLRERVERMRQVADAPAENEEELRALADFVQSGVAVLASALPKKLPTDTQKDLK